MARKQQLTPALLVMAFVALTIYVLFPQRDPLISPSPRRALPELTDDHLHGTATAPKLENATLKAELGNAAWKLLHTTMAKFPDHPTEEDSSALESFMYLFARLYPCGECARHFQAILEKFPPQVGSRSNAATWACHVHNQVNKSLKKEEFDCSKIGDFYDCGCADDDNELKVKARATHKASGGFHNDAAT